MKKLMYISVSLVIFITTFFQASHTVIAAAQSKITRSQVEQRALSMINLTWTFSKAKNTNINSKYASVVALPNQFKGITTVKTSGIPYNWGGLDGLDFKSYNEPWNNFLDAVSRGAYTGNVSSKGGNELISGTAGIDCSGFVQAAYNIKDYKQSTFSLLQTYFKKIDLSELKHMDILDYPGVHVVIFDKWGTLNGVEGALTYESTVNQIHGGIQGTKKYFISKATINKGYISARYINIIDNTPTPTPTAKATPTPTPKPKPTPTTAPINSSMPHPVDVGVFAKISDKVSWVNLRSTPSNSSSIISAVPMKSIVYISNYSLGWYKLSYNGQSGWIWGNFISPIPKSKYVTLKNNTYQLNIRQSPSSISSIVGYISQNQYAEVRDYSDDGKWMKISINGIEGWAYSDYLSYIY